MNNPYEKLKEFIGQKMSYEDFCKKIDEPIMDRKNKSKQLKKLKDFIDIQNDKNGITINHIYDEKHLLLLEKKAKFTEYIEDVLIGYLATSDDRSPTLTYKDMAEYLCLVNKKYYTAKYNRFEFLDGISKTKNLFLNDEDFEERKYKDIGVFYNISDKLIKEIIKNALKSLKQRSLILYQDTFKVYETVYVPKTDNHVTKTHILNQKEREIFLDLRRAVMKRHGIDKMQDIVYLNQLKRKEYFDDLSSTMEKCDALHNASRYASAFQIEYGESGIAHEYKRLQNTNRNLLNYNMQYKLLTTEELGLISSVLRDEFVDKLVAQ